MRQIVSGTEEECEMSTRKCFLCGGQFQFGPQAYLGTEVKPWGIMVCNDCRASQRGGIVPALYPHLIEHLKARGVEPEYDDHGWVRWPMSN
jgi:hypothetical protein